MNFKPDTNLLCGAQVRQEGSGDIEGIWGNQGILGHHSQSPTHTPQPVHATARFARYSKDATISLSVIIFVSGWMGERREPCRS